MREVGTVLSDLHHPRDGGKHRDGRVPSCTVQDQARKVLSFAWTCIYICVCICTTFIQSPRAKSNVKKHSFAVTGADLPLGGTEIPHLYSTMQHKTQYRLIRRPG
jgi:hypothetical protein